MVDIVETHAGQRDDGSIVHGENEQDKYVRKKR